MSQPETITLPDPPPGMCIVLSIRMPIEMGFFAATLKLAARAFGKEARLLPAGGWAHVVIPKKS
jgi:hypothetical protein